MVVDLVAAECQVGGDGDAIITAGSSSWGSIRPSARPALLDVAVAGDRLVGVLDRRQQIGDAELAAGSATSTPRCTTWKRVGGGP